VLLLVAPKEHKVRIEVGYGLEGTLTDAASSVIISSVMVPRFKTGDFSGGITGGSPASSTCSAATPLTGIAKSTPVRQSVGRFHQAVSGACFLSWMILSSGT